MSTPTPSAMSGSTPMVTNSVVPMAKPPIARAITATTTRTVLRVGRPGGGASACEDTALTPPAKCRGPERIPGSARPAHPPQLSQVRRRCGPTRRARRQPLEAGLPDRDVVPGLGQLGVAQQQLRTAAAQDRLPEQRTHPLAGDGDPGRAG